MTRNALVTERNIIPTSDAIRQAAERIRPFVHRTPVMTNRTLDVLTGAQLFFKCENLQKIGAFKIRGATNAVFSLSDEEAARGVATHSSGNHAQALAYAARERGIRATIVMPETAPRVKVEAVKGYGGGIIFCKPTAKDREETLDRFIKKSGATLIHPYNDYRIIAGQATAAAELIEEAGDLDIVVAPVGGGGLLSGASLTVHYFSPATKVFGAEPEQAADAFRSLRDNKIYPSENPRTIADGLLTSLGDKTFGIIRNHTHRILTVKEDNIRQALRLIFERMKLVAEPSGAVPLASILEHPDLFRGKRTGAIISGGNVDLSVLSTFF